MSLAEFKKYNNIIGWAVFAIAALVYALTMESSASFWDCGEFIAASYKLQVVHPPGAPVFLMIGRLFTLLAFGNVEMVSVMMNFMSALCSAFAMLFLFWSITHLARRAVVNNAKTFDKSTAIAILGSGAVGALAGTFCDSIWFSAVEAEVYSMSLFFTSLVVWLMLKWDEHANEPYADRWLILIFFIMGVSIGVHWLNLLTIPAMSYLYYFRRYKFSYSGFVATGIISVVILGFILKVVITGFASIATSFEITFVNSFGLPFNSGVFTFLALFIALFIAILFFLRERFLPPIKIFIIIFGVILTWFIFGFEIHWFFKVGLIIPLLIVFLYLVHLFIKNNLQLTHNIVLAITMMMIGFSPLVTTVIRANADTPINMNDPKDMPSLMSFLNREQYGSRPLLSGQYYYSKVVDTKDEGVIYQKGKEKYDVVGKKFSYVYDEDQTGFFPRMHSDDPGHIRLYEQWTGLRKGKRPTFGDNLEFLWKYQLGWMYWRYFNWNFVGRQNDIQGVRGIKDGNWLSGIGFLDARRLGPQADLPDYKKNNESRNTYFFIPLIIGLIGFFFHFKSDRKRAFAILALFVSMGLMLIIYGNSPPIEPRERDYIFAGSFWSFCIFLGLGVMGIYNFLKEKISAQPAAFVAIAIAIIAPILMGTQGWDDHNRSGSTIARDMARNYLESCEPNAILFTQGDNDTYPLWYVQEVEGIRTDVRIVNLSLLGVDWYINQLRKKSNDADAVAFSVSPDKYRGDKRNMVSYVDLEGNKFKDKFVELSDVIAFMNSDDKRNQLETRGGRSLNYFPTKNFSINVDKNSIIQNNVVSNNDTDKIVEKMAWKVKRDNLLKNDIYMLDIIAKNAADGWKRPVYFAVSINPDSFLGLEKYFQLEGLTFRLVPVEANVDGPYTGRIRSDVMYDNLMNDFTFGNIEKPGIATTETIRRMATNLRSNYSRLAIKLAEEGENEKAINVLDKGLTYLSNEKIPYDFFNIFAAEAYFQAGADDKAIEVADKIAENLLEDMDYVQSLPKNMKEAFKRDSDMAELGMGELMRMAVENKREDWVDEIQSRYESLSTRN